MGSLIKQRSPVDGEQIMGLQDFGFVLYPDAETELEIPYVNNRFKLGSSSETKSGLTSQQKTKFENAFGVDFDTPDGQEFLSNWRIKINHLTTPVDRLNIEHEFNLCILQANDGMGIVNMKGTQNDDELARLPFVLIDENNELADKVTRTMTRNQAISELNNLQVKNKEKLVKIAKYLFNLNAEFTVEAAYVKLDEFITSKTSNGETFLKTLKLDDEWIETTVLVKDSMNAGIIRRGEDQYYFNNASGVKLGRTIEEIVKFLSNPDNQDQLGIGSKNDQPYSLKSQLKNKIN